LTGAGDPATIPGVHCPICGSPSDPVARPHPYVYARCRDCGAYFVDPMPSPDQVAGSHYDEVYYASAEPRPDEDAWNRGARRAARHRLGWIEQAAGAKGRFLDVGTGTGFQLAAARDAGWEVEGVDVSARAVAFARDTLGVPVRLGTLEQAGFADETFDAVSLTHVLEHVPDPVGLLTEVARILRPNGVAAIAVPNSRALVNAAYNLVHRARGRYRRDKFACGLWPPDHVIGFDARSLREVIVRSALRPLELVVTGKGDPDRYPMASWGRGTRALERPLEWIGRVVGRGSILESLSARGAS